MTKIPVEKVVKYCRYCGEAFPPEIKGRDFQLRNHEEDNCMKNPTVQYNSEKRSFNVRGLISILTNRNVCKDTKDFQDLVEFLTGKEIPALEVNLKFLRFNMEFKGYISNHYRDLLPVSKVVIELHDEGEIEAVLRYHVLMRGDMVKVRRIPLKYIVEREAFAEIAGVPTKTKEG